MKAPEIAQKIRRWLRDGITVNIAYQPSVILEVFNAPSHEFMLALDILKHELRFHHSSGAGYRLASTCHSWQPDMYTFKSPDENKVIWFSGHEGRNGGSKRKWSQSVSR